MTAPLTYNFEQAAERIGHAVSASWLKRHAAAGDIPHTRSGAGRGRAGRVSFTEAHLVEILQKIEHRPSGSSPAQDEIAELATSVISRGSRRSA